MEDEDAHQRGQEHPIIKTAEEAMVVGEDLIMAAREAQTIEVQETNTV